MKLTHFHIHPQLKGHVEKLWVFESDHPIPPSDIRTIVPNGLIKMVIPFRNGLRATLNNEEIIATTDTITLIGVADIPSVVVDESQGPCGSIGIEFNPAGAHRFFDLSLNELKNQVVALSTAIGNVASALQERITNTVNVHEKVRLVEQFLLSRFHRTRGDEVFEFCINQITASKGRIHVAELEKKTGYSSRWLNMKFFHRIGISPKNLSSVIRFQEIYHGWAKTDFKNFHGIDLYSYYHDQAHFIKDFKRFTGYSPAKFQRQENDFGKIFYRG